MAFCWSFSINMPLLTELFLAGMNDAFGVSASPPTSPYGGFAVAGWHSAFFILPSAFTAARMHEAVGSGAGLSPADGSEGRGPLAGETPAPLWLHAYALTFTGSRRLLFWGTAPSMEQLRPC